ncbi:hypothetical protein B0I35DRAFT_141461 [Stachybotrys elegans]|uniref:Uncharacterized protein n=1 Tax=Stachybotrys elegans TaxID=80388 RepID=A0A8K0WVH4_9HYPO|nr:hypothetical protein B0I35DRAFT_141461 [Stachybotrys elegans]
MENDIPPHKQGRGTIASIFAFYETCSLQNITVLVQATLIPLAISPICLLFALSLMLVFAFLLLSFFLLALSFPLPPVLFTRFGFPVRSQANPTSRPRASPSRETHCPSWHFKVNAVDQSTGCGPLSNPAPQTTPHLLSR